MKICKKCNIEKTESSFYKQTRRSDGLHPWCKDCCKTYAQENVDAKRECLRKWRFRNPDRVKELDKRHRIKARTKRSIYNTKYHAERRIYDLGFKLAGNLRNRLRLALKNQSKRGRTFDYVGCSAEQLRNYLESKFLPGMTWENYGKDGWHVDHVKPLCVFDLSSEEQLKKAMHYSNLQPLWAEDNLSKGGR